MTFRLACDGKEFNEVNMMYRKCANYFKADAMRNIFVNKRIAIEVGRTKCECYEKTRFPFLVAVLIEDDGLKGNKISNEVR